MSANITMGPVLPPHTVDPTIGALYLGVMIAMALWGASSVQTYYYFNRYRDDAIWIKLLVTVVWIFDTAHQGMIIHTVYTYLVTEYGHVEYLNIIVRSLVYEVGLSASITILVQGFFVARVWRLSHKNIYLTSFLGATAIGEFVVSLIYTGKAIQMQTFTQLTQLENLSRAINGVGAGGDIVIAMTMIWLLHGSRTGFQKSDTIINRLILFSMNTGLLTSLWAITSLVTITVMPSTFWYIMFYVSTCKLYVNSLLATLNSRRNSRGGHPDSTQEGSISMNRMTGRDVEATLPMSTLPMNKPHRGAHALSIKVDTETRRDYPSDNHSLQSTKMASSVDEPASFLDTKGDAL